MSTTARRPSRSGVLLRALIAVAAATALVLALPLEASAHVTVSAPGATAGGYARLTFSVPTESETERTVRVEVELPVETPFTSVRTVRVPGWTAQLVRTTLDEPVAGAHGTEIAEAVTRVVWTADTPDDGITPEETGLFTLSVGPLPDVDEVFLPALQVYDSGREVFWSQQASGDAEPEHPAPSVLVAPAVDEAAASVDAAADAAPAPIAASGPDGWGIAATIAAFLALVIAIAAWLTARRGHPVAVPGSPSSPAPPAPHA